MQYLQSKLGINLNGVILLSAAIDFQTFSFHRGNDLAYVLAVPSYTAAAWCHKRLSPRLQLDLKPTLSEVEQWIISDYLPALALGKDLPPEQRAKIATKLAEYTGLSKPFLDQSDLRVSANQFAKELLRNEHQKIGILDSRVIGADLAPWNNYEDGDPAMALVTGPLVAAINHYMREDLQFNTDLPYQFLSMSTNQSWKWGSAIKGYLNVSAKLKEALTADPHLHLFMAAGYYDLTTPYFAQQYTRDHLGLDKSLWPNVVYHTYLSGHQIYNPCPAMEKLKDDVAVFFKDSL